MKYSAGFTWGTIEAWKCCTESMADTHKFKKCVAFLVFLSGKPGSAEKYFCIAITTYERRLYCKEGTCYKSHKLNNILICTVQNWITWGRRGFLKFIFCWMVVCVIPFRKIWKLNNCVTVLLWLYLVLHFLPVYFLKELGAVTWMW